MVELGVDYWEFTVPYDNMADLLAVIPCGVEPLRNRNGDVVGWRGYTHSGFVAQDKGRVGWSPDDQRMGVHVSLGGEALRVLAALDDRWRDLPSVMAYVLQDLGGHTTRVDLAWDDKEGLLDLDEVGSALAERRFVSRWRQWQHIDSDKLTDGGWVRGDSYYMGSGKSDAQLRCYDKRAERLQKGHDVEADHWVRVELQLRRKRSDAAARLYTSVTTRAGAVMRKLTGVLRGYVEFKQQVPDPNKSRWPVAAWWLRFLGWAEKAKLATVEAEARTVQDVKSWVSAQVAPSLALLEDALGFDRAWAFLFAEAQEGRLRFRARHRAILSASGVMA